MDGDDQRRRHELLRQQVAEQAALLRHLRIESKALRAAASAVVDQSVALRLAARGLVEDPTPPIPTHPPEQ